MKKRRKKKPYHKNGKTQKYTNHKNEKTQKYTKKIAIQILSQQEDHFFPFFFQKLSFIYKGKLISNLKTGSDNATLWCTEKIIEAK